MTLGAIGFVTPWLLIALFALPILWLILRAVPPAPVREYFPGVMLLLGLRDDDSESDRTPWWLLLLRMLAVAAIIIGLAGPVLNPNDQSASRSGPLLILSDASWASAENWADQSDLIAAQLNEAKINNRPVALVRLSNPEPPSFQAADQWRTQLGGLTPLPWTPSTDQIASFIDTLGNDPFETLWISDGLDWPDRGALYQALSDLGPVTVFQNSQTILGLRPAVLEDGAITLSATRSRADQAQDITIDAIGTDPSGAERILSQLPLTFEADARNATSALSLPAELRARLTRFQIAGQQQAGAATLSDDSLKRREVALIAGRKDREGLELLSPLHYLEKALITTADLLDGTLTDILPANPDVIVLADVAALSGSEQAGLIDWVSSGGLLLRFAGPRTAASDISRTEEAPLMPVRLRSGGRTVGGAMSWGEPKSLAPFTKESPFSGLAIPADVTVSAQVMAQPDPTLAQRMIAQLSDGTPLVTRKKIGQGQVILFHVTANAEWSTLPLSGLFVEMLERLAVSSAATQPDPADLAGTIWQPQRILDGFGTLQSAANLPGIAGEDLLTQPLGTTLWPGLYAGPERTLARNIVNADTLLAPATWPAGTTIRAFTQQVETPLGGWLLTTALLLMMVDIIASLAMSGRLFPAKSVTALLALALLTPQAEAQDIQVQGAAAEIILAHVLTGDATLDRTANAGLRGLTDTLFFRTSVEPANPVGVDLETDNLSVYPLLYWPVTPDQPLPSSDAYSKLNTYLRQGGMILFDTRDADIAGFGASSPNGAKLQRLAAALDIPPLEPLPSDHVLTRTFYLLQDYPGRHNGRNIWVEAAPPDAEKVEGMPFRNLNDGVTPVIIGGNDWASAWAVDAGGQHMFPVGRGFAGERQRELAYRFGVNLVMHVLTGNYKSDQVHVPALLNRLGQ